MSSHWKQKFPALTNHDIAYLDTASSCQLPAEVIQSISHYLQNGHGNPHRGMYPWSEKAEQIAQQCRKRVARLLSCNEQKIAFTKSTTESINIVANSLRDKLNAQHTIIVTQMEHHANLLPWQRLCQQTGAQLKLLPLKPNGELDLTNLSQWLSDNCALFAFTHVSNVIGTINPVHQMVQMAKQNNVPTLIDGAQAIAHQPVNITEIDCDYYAFSGHKLYAAGGIGVLYARNPQSIEPLLVGGGIVNRVTDNQYHLID